MRVLLLLLLMYWKFAVPTGEDDGDGEPRPKKLKTSCYFENPLTSNLEKFPRDPRYVVSSKCEGALHSLISLAENFAGNFFGAINEFFLVMGRAEGTFLNEFDVPDAWERDVICDRHWDELSRKYFMNEFGHVKPITINGEKFKQCGYPEVHSARGTHTMSHIMSKNVLIQHSILVPAGVPLCKRHYDGIPKQSVTPRCSQNSYTHLDPYSNPNSQRSSHSQASQSTQDSSDDPNFIPSQECDDDDDAWANEGGDDEEDEELRKETRSELAKFFAKAGIKKAFCRRSLTGDKPIQEKTLKDKIRLVYKIMRSIIGLMVNSVEDQELLLSSFIDSVIGKNARGSDDIFNSLMSGIADQFNSLKKYREKVQLLSLFAPHVKYSVMFGFIPNLSEKLFYDAKRMGKDAERKQPDLSKRERFDRVKLDYFISFITSHHIMVGLPWGLLKTKDSAGNTITLPNTVRLVGIYEGIEMYETWMRQHGRELLILSSSTTYKLFSKLPSVQSTAKLCVDYFMADAKMGFLKIQEHLKTLTDLGLLDENEAATLKRIFNEIENYLRSDFKLHVKDESRIADHCMNWALSDPEDHRFSSPPSTPHHHDWTCPECDKLDYISRDWMARIDTMVLESDASNEAKLLDIQHDFKKAMEKITEYKAHILRSVFSANVREFFINGLQEGEGFVTLDFAQKYQASYYMESQKDYFGKPGKSWHFSHVFANISGELVQHTYCHILENEAQTSSIVSELLKHITADLASMGVNKITLRSDNAGYYHSSPLMATIPSISKDITAWSFSEPQAGKSDSDRWTSFAKRIMMTYLAKGNDIDTHEKMFKALTEGKQLTGFSVHWGVVETISVPKVTIPGIQSLGHFEFTGDTISAWKFKGIGKGMKVSGLEGIKSKMTWRKHGGKESTDSNGVSYKDQDMQKIANGEKPHFWFFPSKKVIAEPDDVDDEAVTGNAPVEDSMSSSPLFPCDQCSATFLRYSNLIRHLENGRHRIKPEKVSMYDFALGLYKRHLEQTQQGVGMASNLFSESLKAYQSAPKNPKEKGWAQSSRKKGGKYPPIARQLVVEMFEEYYGHAKKLRAEQVDEKMRQRNDIPPSERMSIEQINNCIRNLLINKRKANPNRRRRALLADWILELEEELKDVAEYEEVEVPEDERVFDSGDVYDMVFAMLNELYDKPSEYLTSNDDKGDDLEEQM